MTALAEQRRQRDIVAEVLAAQDPNERLRYHLEALEVEVNPELLCDVFEALVWRVNFTDYWIFHAVAKAYQALHREEAAFLIASTAERSNPAIAGSQAMNGILHTHLRARGLIASAAVVSNWHNALATNNPVQLCAESEPLLPLFGKANVANSDQTDRAEQMAAQVLATANSEDKLHELLSYFDDNKQQYQACLLF